jgi:hypothetical protein
MPLQRDCGSYEGQGLIYLDWRGGFLCDKLKIMPGPWPLAPGPWGCYVLVSTYYVKLCGDGASFYLCCNNDHSDA